MLDTGSAITASTNYDLRIEVDGTTIRGYVNGVLDLEATHSALSSGSPGVAGYGGNNSNTYCATWAAEDLGGGASQINVTDAGAGADTLAGLAVGLALADSGAGSDAFGTAASLATSDSGTAADVLAQLLASLGIGDGGAGVDVPGNIGAGLVVGDAGGRERCTGQHCGQCAGCR